VAEPKREAAVAMDEILRQMQEAVDSETARQIQVFRIWKWKYGEGLGHARYHGHREQPTEG
jgi:hypothetical protein